MKRCTGTTARGIRAPIIREGDDLVSFVVESVMAAAKAEPFSFNDGDVIAVTEAVVARAQGNYATVDQIAKDIAEKFPQKKIGLVFPILSRNRFAPILRAVARAAEKITMQLSYPDDEVGNALVSLDQLDDKDINPYLDVLKEEEFYQLFGTVPHPFTKIDYMALYQQICREEKCELKIILANDVREILKYEEAVLTCDVHQRHRSRAKLEKAGAGHLFNLEDILNSSVDGSGFCPQYGLMGANKATDELVKLFPRDSKRYIEEIQKQMQARTGKLLEVMVYGDGAFCDPIHRIWELADPVVSPAYTSGLSGLPAETKLKYLADNEFFALSGAELENAVCDHMRTHKNRDSSLGTTPRRIPDLLGSLADLISGSGDKGTPIVLIQGYFDNIADS